MRTVWLSNTVAQFTNSADLSPAVTRNKYGKGNAIYLATESNASAIKPLLNYRYAIAGIHAGIVTPERVDGRTIDGRILLVNTTTAEQQIQISGSRKATIAIRVFKITIVLGPIDANLFQ